ncbi:MAG TPA: endo-1,4-beta-xylanase, partial [Planctomycetota bacterium]|nr:endo-1,4-beta-xylanase [Planctomycetota bacterium]
MTTPEVPKQTTHLPPWMDGWNHLRKLALRHGLLIGAGVSWPQLESDSQLRQTLAREYSMLSPGVELKLGAVQPQRGVFDFNRADRIVAFAEAHQMAMHGHVLVWHIHQPAWIYAPPLNRQSLADELQRHIYTVAGRYRGRIACWDVVNEALEKDGSLTPTFWHRQLGPEYIDLAFRWAHEADPTARLFYNDFGCQARSPKADALVELARGLLDRGVPLHGIGLQAHLSLDDMPAADDLACNIQRLGSLGLEVQITELDVVAGPQGSRDERLERQGQAYFDVMRVAVEAPNCTAVGTWGIADCGSWLGKFDGPDDVGPLPWDRNYSP